MMETLKQFSQIIHDNGTGVVIAAAIGLFFYFKFWPWWTAKDSETTKERSRVNDKLIATLDSQQSTMSDMSHSLGRISENQVQHTGMISDLTSAVKQFRCEAERK